MMEALGRGHKVEKTYEAYSLLRENGALRVNLDLIFGAPGQTLAMWEEDLHKAVELDPEHLSTYCLTFEEDTAMYLRLAEGKVRLEPEREAAFYEKAWALPPRDILSMRSRTFPSRGCLVCTTSTRGG